MEIIATAGFFIDSAFPVPVTELDLPPVPRVEDNPWMLHPLQNSFYEKLREFKRVYEDYYESYKFEQPITLRFSLKPTKYVVPTSKRLLLSLCLILLFLHICCLYESLHSFQIFKLFLQCHIIPVMQGHSWFGFS